MSYKMQAALVRSILERYTAYDWTVQGFGMVRTKIADVGRIHVWDSRLATPLVSTVHAHPWPLKSLIISGELLNQRFLAPTGVGPSPMPLPSSLSPEPPQYGSLPSPPLRALPYMLSRIATGEGGGLVGEARAVSIWPLKVEAYYGGDTYEQTADEVHRSIPQDGTVTLLQRPMGPPLQETSVYWPAGTEWVSAEPRRAEKEELRRAIDWALARWNTPN